MKNLNLLYISIIVVIIIISGIYIRNLKHELDINKVNISALTDSLTISKNKSGELVYSNNLLMMNIKTLKSTNSLLLNDIDKLSKKDKKNLIEIDKLNILVDQLKDSIKTLNTNYISYKDGIYKYGFSDSTKYRHLSGEINVKSTTKPEYVSTVLLKDLVYVPIVITKVDVENGIKFSASSENPNVVITSMEGSIVNLSKYNKYQPIKKFGIGLHVGYGATVHGLTPYVGIGFSYNLVRF